MPRLAQRCPPEDGHRHFAAHLKIIRSIPNQPPWRCRKILPSASTFRSIQRHGNPASRDGTLVTRGILNRPCRWRANAATAACTGVMQHHQQGVVIRGDWVRSIEPDSGRGFCTDRAVCHRYRDGPALTLRQDVKIALQARRVQQYRRLCASTAGRCSDRLNLRGHRQVLHQRHAVCVHRSEICYLPGDRPGGGSRNISTAKAKISNAGRRRQRRRSGRWCWARRWNRSRRGRRT